MRCRRHRACRWQRRSPRDDSEIDISARRRRAHDTRHALMTRKDKSAASGRSGASTIEPSLGRRMPAEWEKHDATWIAWPHHEPDWPGKLAPIPWVYAEIVRALSEYEKVEILCHDATVGEGARSLLVAHGVSDKRYRLHSVSNDR